MRVLVTGGTGYLGQAIVRALAARGHEPVVFARRATTSGLPGTLVDGDIRDVAAVDQAAAGCDAICHTAALVRLWHRPRRAYEETNVGGLRHVLAAARAHRTRRIVYTSSFLARAPAGRATPLAANDYQATKLRAAALAARAAAEGAPLVRLYPGVIYGPGPATEGNLVGRLVADHLAGRLPGLVGADRPWSFAFVDDVAAGHVAALEQAAPGAAYVLGGENAPPQRVFEILRELTGRPLPRRIPFAVAWAAALLDEARAVVTGRPPRLTRGAVTIFRHDWSLDSEPAVRELGYRITPLREGLARLLAAR
jgi:farnesol dehydrogenase